MHCPELTWTFWKTQKTPPGIGLRQLSIPVMSDGQNFYSVPCKTENYSYSSGFTSTSCPPRFFQWYILYTHKWCYIYFSIWHLKTHHSPMVNKPSPPDSKARMRLVAAALPKEFVNNCQEARPPWLNLCHILSTGISLLSRPRDEVIQATCTEAHTPYLKRQTVPYALHVDPAPVFLHSRLMTRDLAANTWSTAWTARCSDITPLICGLRPSWKESAIMYPQAGTVVT